jgi:hypothetical protein
MKLLRMCEYLGFAALGVAAYLVPADRAPVVEKARGRVEHRNGNRPLPMRDCQKQAAPNLGVGQHHRCDGIETTK